ncbi:unnamed protein product, partial [Rotaria sp. Silwood2]
SGELSKEAILKLRAKIRATARDKIVDLQENKKTLKNEFLNEKKIITRGLFGVAPSVTVFNVKP